MKNLRLLFITFFCIGCSSFYYYPQKRIYFTPKQFKKEFNELEIITSDQKRLKAWKIKSKNPQNTEGLILQFHGNAENMSTHMTSLIWLTDYNFDLLTFDYRGYGKSSGKPSAKGLREDALSMINFSLEQVKKFHYKKLIIVAQSLGGAVAMDALSFIPKEYQKNIDLLVLESTFSSYKKMASNILKKHWLTYLFSPLGFLIATNKTSPHKVLEKLFMPKLILHSKNDPVVSFSEGKKLFKKLPAPKEMWSYEEKSHIGSFFIEEKKYRSKFIKYLSTL